MCTSKSLSLSFNHNYITPLLILPFLQLPMISFPFPFHSLTHSVYDIHTIIFLSFSCFKQFAYFFHQIHIFLFGKYSTFSHENFMDFLHSMFLCSFRKYHFLYFCVYVFINIERQQKNKKI